MRIVLDTDVASHTVKKTLPPAMFRRLLGHETAISFVTVGELEQWIHLSNLGVRRRGEVDAFVAGRVKIPGGHDVARKWGEIMAHATKRGRPRPVNDSWIAAVCLTYDLPLATLNEKDFRDFAEHEGLRLITI